MALAAIAEGTQTAVIGTEHTLVTDTSGKTYVLVVDTKNMVLGDVLELRIKTKVLTGGAEGEAYIAHFSNVQAQSPKYSVPVPADISFVATLKQVAGTGRDFAWKVQSLD